MVPDIGYTLEVGFPTKDNPELVGRRMFYHPDLSAIEIIKKNLTHILLEKKYSVCSNKEVPATGNCIAFEDNIATYCENEKVIETFDLTKPLPIEKLDQLYKAYSSKKVKVVEELGLEKNEGGILEALQQLEEEGEDPTRSVSSAQMFKHVLQKNQKPAYVDGELCVGTQSWTPITSLVGQACDGAFASMGSSRSREICTVDYNNSTVIKEIYAGLKKSIETEREAQVSKASYNPLGFEQFILQATMQKVQEVFNETKGEAGVARIVDEERRKEDVDAVFLDSYKMPIISLDTFIKQKTGICRHRAMLFLVLASQLKKDNLLLGEVRQVRGLVNGGAHSWNVYCSPMMKLESREIEQRETDIYLIDAMWNNFLSLTLTSKGYNPKKFDGYLTGTERSIQGKLKKHISSLEKQNLNKLMVFSAIGKEDTSTQKSYVNSLKTKNILGISESSSEPLMFTLTLKKTEKNNPVFVVPKKDVNEELFKHFREELSTEITDDHLKKFYDKYVKKTGGTLRLLVEDRVVVYNGSTLTPFVR